MTACPGRYQPYARKGTKHRDLTADLQTIRDCGAVALVTLAEAADPARAVDRRVSVQRQRRMPAAGSEAKRHST